MRRNEFSVSEEPAIREFLRSVSFGFLAQPGEDFPSLTPLNFVLFEEDICFHGSRVGEKMDVLRAGGQATFCVASEVALVPSTFSGSELACPATAFFKSVVIRGRLEEVTDPQLKLQILAALLEKLQPEGGYLPFDLNNPEYRKQISGVSVVRLRTLERTAKFKFGQNQPRAKWTLIRDNLKTRGLPGDLEAVAEMQARCPFKHDEPSR